MTINDLIQSFHEALGFAIDNAPAIGTSASGVGIAMVGIFILMEVEHYRKICKKSRYGAPAARLEAQLIIILGCGISLIGAFIGVFPWMA